MKKTLVVSSYAPPNRGGSPVYLGRLLKFFPKGSYAIFTKEISAFSKDFKSGVWLPVNYYFLYQATAMHGYDLENSKLMVNQTVTHDLPDRTGIS